MTESVPPPRVNRFARLRAATDRVPTKWFAAIGTTLFLAATAAFGGLNDVAAQERPPLPVRDPGEVHKGPILSTTVQRAVLIDRLPGAGAFPDEEKGERLLVLLVTVENHGDEAVEFGAFGGVLDKTVRLSGDPRTAAGIVREDDQTPTPWLQPDLPTLLAFSWTVGGSDYAEGDDLVVELRDAELQAGQLLYTGLKWTQPELAATVRVPIEDVGAGVEEDG